MSVRPGQKLRKFTAEDDETITRLRAQVPPVSYAQIGRLLVPDRTGGTVKNRWSTVILTGGPKKRGGRKGSVHGKVWYSESEWTDMRFEHPFTPPKLGLGITMDMVRAGR